jgi:hypothetical protein
MRPSGIFIFYETKAHGKSIVLFFAVVRGKGVALSDNTTKNLEDRLLQPTCLVTLQDVL